jgi:phosphoribosyl-AMP cyclohydrolase
MESEGLLFSRGSKEEIEAGDRFMPKFDSDGLIPCVTCDHVSGEVLMVAYMNAESLAQTMQKGEAVYWSRSRQELWHKGATSGQIQHVVSMRVDCDQDCLVILVEQAGGGACHTGHRSCFYREVELGSGALHDVASTTVSRLD